MLSRSPSPSPKIARRALLAAALACASAWVPGCATPTPTQRFYFFAESRPGSDPWFDKIRDWRSRAREESFPGLRAEPAFTGDGPRAPSLKRAETSGLLRNKLWAFEAQEKRVLAKRVNDWAQIQARMHYKFDAGPSPSEDHWPTVQELLARNGDDCDGLDLITYQLLREFGFGREEIYRAIVKRDRDGRNHMITLYFEDRDDPWVLDATGAMTRELRRFSVLPGWTPMAMFNEFQQFSIVERGGGRLARAAE